MAGIVEKLSGAVKSTFSGSLHILRVLSGDPSTLEPEDIQGVRDDFEEIRNSMKDIRMVHSLLTAILLWPLALLLCCPISCCLACVVGGLIICLAWLLAVVLFVVGTLLFTPLPGMGLAYDASNTVETIVQTISDISRESLKALEKISEQGHRWPVAIALKGVEFIVEQIEMVSDQLKTLLKRDSAMDGGVKDKLQSSSLMFERLLKEIGNSVSVLSENGSKKETETEMFDIIFSSSNHREHSREEYREDRRRNRRHHGHGHDDSD